MRVFSEEKNQTRARTGITISESAECAVNVAIRLVIPVIFRFRSHVLEK
jgi:hypothetical protein